MDSIAILAIHEDEPCSKQTRQQIVHVNYKKSLQYTLNKLDKVIETGVNDFRLGVRVDHIQVFVAPSVS